MTEYDTTINHLKLIKQVQDEIGKTEPTKNMLVFIFVYSVAAIVYALLTIADAIADRSK